MQQLAYPEIDAHIAAHNNFRTQLKALLNEDHPDNYQQRDMLSTYLSEWLKLHVMGIDKKLERFILDASRK